MKRKLSALLLALIMLLALLPQAFTAQVAVADSTPIDQNIVEGGAILHCFDWSYQEIIDHLDDIAAAGYTAVQTSPVQPPKDYNAAWTDGGGQWWKLYQPLGFRIAGEDETWLCEGGETLADLCEAAHKKGIKVIVDVVANHLANKEGGGYYLDKDGNGSPDDLNGDGEINASDANLSEQVDDAFQNHPEYFHANTAGVNDGSRYNMTQNQMGMPDLNTSNQFVQQEVYTFLVECVNCGVDGFRFDAAKHIELPGDSSGKSDFWSAILDGKDTDGDILGIRNYAGADNLFIYGESLSGGSGESWVQEFATYMALTDSDYGGRVRNAIGGMNAGMLGDGNYVRCSQPRNNVVWVESHDTYEDGGSVWLTDDQIIKAWAIVGARADSTALYFARPNDVMGAASSDTTWKSKAVAEVNKFKNHFSGTSEYLHSDYGNKVAWIERGKNGAVISKLNGGGDVLLPVHQMANGTYVDQLSNNTFTVSNGLLSGTVGDSGVAVLYDKDTPAENSDANTPTGNYIQATPLYLVPNSNWKQANARFAMYVFDENGNSAWVDLTDNDGDGRYEAPLPGGHYWTKVIFCRMNPAYTENQWNTPENDQHVWNQTGDLSPDAGTNCYTIAEDAWSNGEGTWSNYNPYAGYYLVGNMNGWAIHPDYQLTLNTNAETEEYYINCDLSTYSRCKIVHTDNGTDITRWYPNGEESDKDFGESGEIEKNGNYNIYFRPGGNDEWSYKYIYAALQTEASGSENAGFYLVGTMTNWKVKNEYKLTEEDGEYSIDKHLSVMDQFKVVYSADGAETSIWYPDPSPNYGADDATRIIGSGVYHISFRPNYDGGEGWFNNCIKVSGCPVTVNIVGNSDLITWSLYTSEGDMDLWQHGEEEMYEPTEVIKLENGDNVVPVGWHVGLEATTKNGINADIFCEITYTDDEGRSIGASGGGDVGSRFRTYVGSLGEGPVIITLTVNTKPTFTTRSLTLGGEIGVNFYMDLSMLSDAEKASSYMTFEVGTENKKVVSQADYDATKTGENGTYGFTCYVNAIEMADDIKPVFHYKLSGDSVEKTVERGSAYSVRMYVVDSLNPENTTPPDATTAALEKKLIEYGHFVQIYLQQLRGWTFGTDYKRIELYGDSAPVYSDSYDDIKAELEQDGYAFSNIISDDSVIEKITYSLVLDSKTTIRVYIKPAANYDGEITVSGDASEATKQSDGRYLVEFKDIGAHELGTPYTIYINGDAATVTVSAMSYVRGMLDNAKATDAAKDAVCSIYYYWQAALNYLNAHQS